MSAVAKKENLIDNLKKYIGESVIVQIFISSFNGLREVFKKDDSNGKDDEIASTMDYVYDLIASNMGIEELPNGKFHEINEFQISEGQTISQIKDNNGKIKSNEKIKDNKGNIKSNEKIKDNKGNIKSNEKIKERERT